MSDFFEKGDPSMEEALSSITSLIGALNQRGFKEPAKVLNVTQFCLIAKYDLKILRAEIIASEFEWHKRLHARHLALLAFECLDDFQPLLGREFRETVTQISQNSLIPESFTRLGKKISKLKKNYNFTLTGIRNNITAHRDQDAEKQLEWIRRINISDLLNLSNELLEWFDDLQFSIIEVVEKEVLENGELNS